MSLPSIKVNARHGHALLAFVFAIECVVFALPTQKTALALTVSDDFNRANGGLGSNWTTVPGTTAPVISGNQAGVGASGVLNSAYWNGSFTSSQFAQTTFTSIPGPSEWGPGVAVRLSGSATGYFLWYGNNANTVSLWRMDNATTWSQLRQSGTLTVSASDTWRIEAIGTTISGYQNGNLVVQATDTNYSTGSPGIWMFNASNKVDDWSGGDLSGSHSVGGSVSGLSGTVVLQDNGGDDASVSAAGAFTFSSLLPTGSAYIVTVRTNPAGQFCTVTNGTGVVGAGNVTNVAVNCTGGNGGSASGSDNFNRADGPLGSAWTDSPDGGMVISGNTVAGINGANGNSGSVSVAGSFNSDQFSQIEVSATPLSGGQWIGPAVRMQGNGDLYVGLYYWNNGSQYMEIFKRTGGSWAGISNQYNCGPLAAGTVLKLEAVGSTLAFLENGVERVATGDTSLTGGSPGIEAYQTATADNWSGGTAGFEAHYLSTDANGVESYDMISANNGSGPQILRVLRPTSPTLGVKHNMLITLPVEAGLSNGFGDGLETLRGLNAQNQYNLTIVEPSFAYESWFADTSLFANGQHETFMTTELVPWIAANLQTSGFEQNWMIGFSKSGIGGMDLTLKHPDLFTLEAAWDWPADASSFAQFGGSSSNAYGTDANFQANYRLTNAFVNARKGPFTSAKRIWIGGYNAFQQDVADFDTLLTSLGMLHDTETPTPVLHRWDTGWIPLALSALYADSLALPDMNAPHVTAFSVPASSNSLTLPVNSFTASDDTSVTGFKITESATSPGASDSGWLGSAPSSYTVSSIGSKTLYGWAKDAAGNVSAAATSLTTVSAPYYVGGTVSGLSGSVVLQNNSTGNLQTVSSNGAYQFPTTSAGGQPYDVVVNTQPSGQSCGVSNGGGTVGSGDVTNVNVSCASMPSSKPAAGGPKGGTTSTPTPTDNPSPTPVVSAGPSSSPSATPKIPTFGSSPADAANSKTAQQGSVQVLGMQVWVVIGGLAALLVLLVGGWAILARVRKS